MSPAPPILRTVGVIRANSLAARRLSAQGRRRPGERVSTERRRRRRSSSLAPQKRNAGRRQIVFLAQIRTIVPVSERCQAGVGSWAGRRAFAGGAAGRGGALQGGVFAGRAPPRSPVRWLRARAFGFSGPTRWSCGGERRPGQRQGAVPLGISRLWGMKAPGRIAALSAAPRPAAAARGSSSGPHSASRGAEFWVQHGRG